MDLSVLFTELFAQSQAQFGVHYISYATRLIYSQSLTNITHFRLFILLLVSRRKTEYEVDKRYHRELMNTIFNFFPSGN